MISSHQNPWWWYSSILWLDDPLQCILTLDRSIPGRTCLSSAHSSDLFSSPTSPVCESPPRGPNWIPILTQEEGGKIMTPCTIQHSSNLTATGFQWITFPTTSLWCGNDVEENLTVSTSDLIHGLSFCSGSFSSSASERAISSCERSSRPVK